MNQVGGQMTAARALPRSLAPVVERLELDQPRLVTLRTLAALHSEIAGNADADPDAPDGDVSAVLAWARETAYQLRRYGWLGVLGTREVWEFQPGARAGAFGSGDRLIELRAQLAVDPGSPLVLAMDSAASMLGLAQHVPERDVVAAPRGVRLPKALRGWRIVHASVPDAATTRVDELPTWTLEALFVGIAVRPSAYHDLAGLGQWLPMCGDRIEQPRLKDCSEMVNAATRQRLMYLLVHAGRRDLAEDIALHHPPIETVWFSTRRPGGHHDPLSRVVDADLVPYLSGGTGA